MRWLAMLLLAAFQTPQYEQTTVSRERLVRSPRHMEYIDVPAGEDDSVTSFVVHPEQSDATDSVVVIHTGLAMTPWIQTVADELAANGYVVVVPDLLSGHGPDGGGSDSFASNVAHRVGTPLRFDEADDIRRAMGKLEPDEITRRLEAAVCYVR